PAHNRHCADKRQQQESLAEKIRADLHPVISPQQTKHALHECEQGHDLQAQQSFHIPSLSLPTRSLRLLGDVLISQVSIWTKSTSRQGAFRRLSRNYLDAL